MQRLRTWVAALQRRRGREKAVVAGAAIVCVVLTILSALLTSGAQAQNGPPPLRAHVGHTVLLSGSMPPALRKGKAQGAQARGTTLHLVISLQLTNPNGLASLIASQRDRKSSQYHKYVKPQDFINTYSPSTQSVDAVRKFLTGAGLKVTKVAANRLLIDATGTVAQAEKAFGVTIDHYKLGNRDVYGPTAPPQIPDSLSTVVLDVAGLDNVGEAHPELIRAASAASSGLATLGPRAQRPSVHPIPNGSPASSSPIAGAFAPIDLRGGYDVANLISGGGSGSGQRVAIVELAPYIANDISQYRSQYGLPNSTINAIPIDSAITTCASGDSSCDNGQGLLEADMDMEVVSALAPDATQDVYVGPNFFFGGNLDVYNQIVIDDNDPVTTTSWGLCEPGQGSFFLNSLDQIFAAGAAQGQSFFAASGDTGSDDCADNFGPGFTPAVDSPASDPYVLGVGGTTLTLSGGSYSSETTWNNTPSAPNASGGGISSYFNQPTYQVGGGVVNSYSTGEREVPDVAADADPNTGYSVDCSSTIECGATANPWLEVGGTSGAAPLWAGIMTDTDGYLAANSVALPGWLNPTIYQLLTSNQTFTPYHDITTGNNDIDYTSTPYAGDYPATACYDMTTGVGSPDAWNIARDLQGGVQTGNDSSCKNTAAVTTELVQDGSFEQPADSSPWQQFSLQGNPDILSSFEAHTGNASFTPCGFPNCDDRVSQTLSIPATVNHAQLRFWVEPISNVPDFYISPPCLDHVYATLSTLDGTPISGGSVLASCPSQQNVFEYQFESFDVTSMLQAHLNQPLTLTFRGATSSEAPIGFFYTSWSIDDVSLAYS